MHWYEKICIGLILAGALYADGESGELWNHHVDIGRYYMTNAMDRGFRLWRLFGSEGISGESIEGIGTALIDELLDLNHEVACLSDQGYAQVGSVYQELVMLLDTLNARIEKLVESPAYQDQKWQENPLMFTAAAILQGCQRRLTSSSNGSGSVTTAMRYKGPGCLPT